MSISQAQQDYAIRALEKGMNAWEIGEVLNCSAETVAKIHDRVALSTERYIRANNLFGLLMNGRKFQDNEQENNRVVYRLRVRPYVSCADNLSLTSSTASLAVRAHHG